LLVAGRYSGSGDGAIQIEGNVSGDTKKFAYDVKFANESTDNDFIPRLWATRRVGYLLDEIRLRGESKELKEEVTELARKYGVVTPFTAYLILEDEQRRNVPLARQTLQKREAEELSSDAVRFRKINEDRFGDNAVADARSFQMLKAAEAPAPAITSGNVEMYRNEAQSAARRPSGSGGFARSKVTGPATLPAQTASQARALEQQSRFAGGKTFFQNGSRWIDSEVQKKANAKRVQVQFGSPEYFDLLAQQPQVKSWLALGTSVEFVIGDTLYEVAD
jgi:Ca-activated chloride channel family protein